MSSLILDTGRNCLIISNVIPDHFGRYEDAADGVVIESRIHAILIAQGLNLDRVFTGSDKGFDLEVLLEHLKAGFDLPAGFVSFRLNENPWLGATDLQCFNNTKKSALKIS